MENKHTIYFNMCNHYKKIYNAKAYVDTSTPKSFKKQSAKTPVSSRINQSNVTKKNDTPEFKQNDLWYITQKQIRYSHPFSKTPFFTCGKENGPTKTDNKSNAMVTTNSSSPMRNTKMGKYSSPLHYHSALSIRENRNITNTDRTIFKYNNNSILKKPHSTVCNRNPRNDVDTEKLKFSSNDVHSCFGDSSSDSAYNEGSVGSRGSSPKQMKTSITVKRTKSVSREQLTKEHYYQQNMDDSNKSDDVLYLQFLKDITDDILKKDIFTNKALKYVFQHHVQQNTKHLNENKMLAAIEHLQTELGIPKDDKFNDIGFGLGNVIADNKLPQECCCENFNMYNDDNNKSFSKSTDCQPNNNRDDDKSKIDSKFVIDKSTQNDVENKHVETNKIGRNIDIKSDDNNLSCNRLNNIHDNTGSQTENEYSDDNFEDDNDEAISVNEHTDNDEDDDDSDNYDNDTYDSKNDNSIREQLNTDDEDDNDSNIEELQNELDEQYGTSDSVENSQNDVVESESDVTEHIEN